MSRAIDDARRQKKGRADRRHMPRSPTRHPTANGISADQFPGCEQFDGKGVGLGFLAQV
jgi:hypothetical protein